MINKPVKINDFQKNGFKRIFYLISFLLSISFISSCWIVNYYLSKSICLTADSSFQKIEGPLVREIYLNENTAYFNIFKKFTKNLTRKKIFPKLALYFDRKKADRCHLEYFNTLYVKNIVVDKKTIATIEGTFFNFYGAISCSLFLILYLLCFFSIKIGIEKIIKTFETYFISPILQLSQDIKENPKTVYPYEIDKIKKNISSLKKNIKIKEEENYKLSMQKKMYEISSQVSHDIKSPLSALSMIMDDLSLLPETTRLILRSSIQRIQDIANNLSIKNNSPQNSNTNVLSSHLISCIIDEIISEKRLHFRRLLNINIHKKLDHPYGLFSNINSVEFKRVLSNLINNSVEAFDNQEGLISIHLKEDQTLNNKIKIIIEDNGKGIPSEIISKLGRRGSTFGKEKHKTSGSGLGLHHAKQTIESWQGSLEIQSKLKVGTKIILSLPKVPPPPWFVPKIEIEKNTAIVILDDDQSIHKTWDHKLKNIGISNDKIFHISCPIFFSQWINENSQNFQKVLYLCDFEFIGSKKNGMGLIEEFNIEKNSILVTSYFEKEEIQKRCEKQKIKLIPKIIVGQVPIERPENDSLHSKNKYKTKDYTESRFF